MYYTKPSDAFLMIESRFGLDAEWEFFPHTNSHEI